MANTFDLQFINVVQRYMTWLDRATKKGLATSWVRNIDPNVVLSFVRYIQAACPPTHAIVYDDVAEYPNKSYPSKRNTRFPEHCIEFVESSMAWLKCAIEQGIDSSDFLASINDPRMMRLIILWIEAGCPEPYDIVYDANAVSNMLNLPTKCSIQTPKPGYGEIIVWWDNDWSFQKLRESAVGQKHMADREWKWLDDKGWAEAESGYYKLLLPVPKSNCKSYADQITLLSGTDWKPAPICVVAIALLIHMAKTGKNILKWVNSCRCQESEAADAEETSIIINIQPGHNACHRVTASRYMRDAKLPTWLYMAAAQKC